MNKPLLNLLARAGLLDREDVDRAQDGDQLLRAVCPVHEGADNPEAFVLTTARWFCNTRGCHDDYGGNLEGLVVALAHSHGFSLKPSFREALAWVKTNIAKLKTMFTDWPTAKNGRRVRSAYSGPAFACSREAVLDSLVVPAHHFVHRGFTRETLVHYDIGTAKSDGVFRSRHGFAVVPLYDLDNSGRCVGYAARSNYAVRGPRWVMSRGLPTTQRMFNYHCAVEANRRTGRVILVEGVADALRCVEAGVRDVVALLGSELYGEQVERLRRMQLEEVVVIPDNDEAGAKLAKQVKSQLAGYTQVRCVKLPAEVKDVGAMSKDEARELLKGKLTRSGDEALLAC